jgi:hypothetical protein
VYHGRTKHIDVDFHFIREKVTNHDVQLRYISTIDQVADIFTKGHTTARFQYLREKLKVCSPISLRGHVKLKKITEDISNSTGSSEPSHNTIIPKNPAPNLSSVMPKSTESHLTKYL